MLTIHVAAAGRAVLVDGPGVVAVGPYEEVVGERPEARVRRWPGVITPGLVNLYGPELLEQAYHPDPRESDELGTEPVTGAALDALEMTDARWGASARRGVQRMLAHGTVAAAGELHNRAVLDAVRRAGLILTGRARRPDGVPALDPFASGGPVLWAPGLNPGTAARFAVFDVPDESALAEHGAATCVATVIAGRLVYRRR
ncbi:hypothetical protein [Streptomyces sp. FIT100]|uniref:hypothetical protein n=1 Tax=Streptomyces sp. FIT100 TaxID=2837956 RepID=UPI0021CA74E9|nr:hypothetical protein [Streptomyces sp. FIT100]UUN28516.1 hypothetical protein KK483_20650 [Streptomyces sp. FIT100]